MLTITLNGGTVTASSIEVNADDQLVVSNDTPFTITVSGADNGSATNMISCTFQFTQHANYDINHVRKVAGSGSIVVTTSG